MTVTVLSVTPVPVIVTVADLELVPVFAEEAVTVIVPSFVPETGETLSQLASSVILQKVLDAMLNVPYDPEAAPRETLVGETFKYVVGICVTVTVVLATPVPAIVTVADLELVPVFAEEAVTVIVPSFVPETGETLSQLPLSVIVQLVFDVMLNVPLDPEA